MRELSAIELDALHEFINVGTARAATALSKMIDQPVRVSVPEFRAVPVTSIPELIGGPETPIVGLFFRLSGDMHGSMMLFFTEPTAKSVVEILTAGLGPGMGDDFEEIERSALKELGNILANSYLNGMADMMKNKLLLSVPFYAADALGAVIDVLLIELARTADQALLMDTVIEISGTRLAGNFIIFPDEASLDRMVKSIKPA